MSLFARHGTRCGLAERRPQPVQQALPETLQAAIQALPGQRAAAVGTTEGG